MRGFLRKQADKVLAKGASLLEDDTPDMEAPQEEEKPPVWQQPHETVKTLQDAINAFDDHVKSRNYPFDTSGLYGVLQAAKDFTDTFQIKERPNLSEKRAYIQINALSFLLELHTGKTMPLNDSVIKQIEQEIGMVGKTLGSVGHPPSDNSNTASPYTPDI